MATNGAQKVITVVGSVNADIIVEISRFPKPGETMAARKNDTGYVLPGGKGANQAVAAKRLGQDNVTVNFIGVFGNDGNAKMLRGVLERENVELSQSLTADVPNGQALIFLNESGENSIIIIGGANQAWPHDSVGEAIANTIKSSDVILLQREIPDHVNEEVAAIAAEAGCTVVSDVGGADSDFPAGMLKDSTFVCPNETELERVSGMPTTNEEEIKAAVKKLQAQGAQNVLVTLGADGSMLEMQDGRSFRLATISPPGDIVDTTGAGDVFRAAFAVGLALELPFEEALRRAAAASSFCITKMGTIPAMPVAKEVDDLLANAASVGGGSHL
mgnify:CR=1 FL=1